MYQRLSALNSEKVFAGVARSGGARSLRGKQVADLAEPAVALKIGRPVIDRTAYGSPKLLRHKRCYQFLPRSQGEVQNAGSQIADPAEGSR